MKRTQVYLPDELHELLRRLSYEQRKSMAQVVREAVGEYVDRTSRGPSTDWEQKLAYMSPGSLVAQAAPTLDEMRELERNPLFHIIGLLSTRARRGADDVAD